MENKKLLFSLNKKDFKIDTFRSGGKGGQHQNKTESGVRITHIESGAIGESRDERSQHQNKRKAFERLINSEKFQKWIKKKTAEVLGIHVEVEQKVAKMMDESNLLIEIKENGKWIKWERDVK